ncbi:MAG: BACON domain-containing protein, partial [Bacteroidales bacterium]|nr:BACON domain-containing protein [Bacteroidales bacterium]
YNSKDFRCFLGYTHIKLSVFPAFIELPWNALGDNTFTVTANKPWFIRDYYPSSFFSINKTSGGAGNTFVTVTAKSVNTGELPRHASFTVVCGSKELTVLINQDFEEGAIIHQ